MRIIFIKILLIFSVSLFAQKDDALIWEISKPGIAHKSYLMGTIHISDDEVFELFSKYKPTTFDSCDVVALEIKLDGNVFEGIFELMVADSDYKIRDYITDEEYDELSAWLKKEHGMKLSRFEQIKPIFFYFLINDFGPGVDNKMFLDEHIYHLASTSGKEQIGLETAAEQIQAFDDIPYEDQFDLLMGSMGQNKKNEKAFKKLVKAYLKQDLDKLEKYISGEMPATFYEKLITNRNQNMLDGILEILPEQKTFIAVGAGHLPGKNGLISMLIEKGYTLKPISNQ
jgi:uncharacterized protein YbaP (TraB family)